MYITVQVLSKCTVNKIEENNIEWFSAPNNTQKVSGNMEDIPTVKHVVFESVTVKKVYKCFPTRLDIQLLSLKWGLQIGFMQNTLLLYAIVWVIQNARDTCLIREEWCGYRLKFLSLLPGDLRSLTEKIHFNHHCSFLFKETLFRVSL